MNEVSIIINGVRYDSATPRYADDSCNECDLADFCQKAEMHYTCPALIGMYRCFKKSDKKMKQDE